MHVTVLRRYCLRNRQATMMDIATWARKIIISQQSPLLHQEMRLEIVLLCKEEGIYSFCTQTLWQTRVCKCKMDRKTVETCSLVRQVHIPACFGRRILHAKDEKDHPDCYQRKVQKPASVMVWGCISVHGMGDLHICEGTIDAEAYVGILERHMLPSMSISAGQCQASFYKSYNSVASLA